MLTYVRGNLFDTPAKVLVNTVNTVGVMGKGIALTFKQIFPEMFQRYQALCESKKFDTGQLWLYRTANKWVLNFPTKKHWKGPSKLEYIQAGLEKFVDTYSRENITSIAFPQLGCGNGELDWEDVHPLMVKYLRPLPINVYIYLYDRDANARPEHKDLEAMKRWVRSDLRVLAFEEFWNDLKDIVGQGISLTSRQGDHFEMVPVRFDSEGFLFYVGERTWLQTVHDEAHKRVNGALRTWRFGSNRATFIPEESFLELWQSIRFYGFCHPEFMPESLHTVSDFILPLLERVEYLKPVKVAVSSKKEERELDDALQLYLTIATTETKGEEAKPVAF